MSRAVRSKTWLSWAEMASPEPNERGRCDPGCEATVRGKNDTMTSRIFPGTVRALMTPCGAARSPDFDALVSKAKELVRAGMSAVVYCGSMDDCLVPACHGEAFKRRDTA